MKPSPRVLLAPAIAFLLAGCIGPRPLHGGHATTTGPLRFWAKALRQEASRYRVEIGSDLGW